MSDIFRETLLAFAERVEGVHGISLVGRDGIAIDSIVPAGDGILESISAELIGVLASFQAADLGIDAQAIRQLLVETDRAAIVLSAVTSEYYLLILMSAEGNKGRARFEARKAALLLEKELI
jgi:predicted regulator of Ras-like GTPase activity (Roadblock/LC7/MglB family)